MVATVKARRPSSRDSAEGPVIGFEHAAEGASGIRAAHLRAVEDGTRRARVWPRAGPCGQPSTSHAARR